VKSDGETSPRGRAGVAAGKGDKLRLERHYWMSWRLPWSDGLARIVSASAE
jgi:hypothetical protein